MAQRSLKKQPQADLPGLQGNHGLASTRGCPPRAARTEAARKPGGPAGVMAACSGPSRDGRVRGVSGSLARPEVGHGSLSVSDEAWGSPRKPTVLFGIGWEGAAPGQGRRAARGRQGRVHGRLGAAGPGCTWGDEACSRGKARFACGRTQGLGSGWKKKKKFTAGGRRQISKIREMLRTSSTGRGTQRPQPRAVPQTLYDGLPQASSRGGAMTS